MVNSKTCVGVVFGGISGEHNVSIKSAETVVNALTSGINENHFDVLCIYIDKKGKWWPSTIALKALAKGFALEDHELPSNESSKGFEGLPLGAHKFGKDSCAKIIHKF